MSVGKVFHPGEAIIKHFSKKSDFSLTFSVFVKGCADSFLKEAILMIQVTEPHTAVNLF